VLSTIDSSGEPTALSALEQLIKQIASLRTQLADAAQVITTIHERLSGTSEAKLPAEKVEQVVQLTVRLAATFGDVEARLQKTTEGLSDAQNRIEEAKTRVQRWIHASAIGVTLLILLMAAGQVALCRLAAKTEY
jgi:methyl-accepting chemotaxis protein